MKYNVGDKVKIREDLVIDNVYGVDSFVDEMEKYKGRTAIITDVSDRYQIDIDNGEWFWTDDMFEDYIEDIEKEKTVDIGFHLDCCGHKVIKNVYYGGYAHDHDHVFCTTVDSKNQYTLPVGSIDFIIPHED